LRFFFVLRRTERRNEASHLSAIFELLGNSMRIDFQNPNGAYNKSHLTFLGHIEAEDKNGICTRE
jgi:hypothetical protein